MRERTTNEKFALTAYSATNAVLLAWNVNDAASLKGCLGFAIERLEHGTDKRFFLSAGKSFKSESKTADDSSSSSSSATGEAGSVVNGETPTSDGKSARTTTLDCPVQSFHWSDYTVKSDTTYEFRLYPMTGQCACSRVAS